MKMPPEHVEAWNVALADLVGLQLQGITLAMPVDLSFGPESIMEKRDGHWLRFESPFALSGADWSEVITPFRYGPNVLNVVNLLWDFVEGASIDGESKLHLALRSGTRLDVLPDDHLEWSMDMAWFVDP